MTDDLSMMSVLTHALTHKVLFYSFLFYSILFTSILFYSIPFKSNLSIRGISCYSSSSLTSVQPALNLRVYKASPIVEYSLTLTIKSLRPNPSVKPECLCQLLILCVHNSEGLNIDINKDTIIINHLYFAWILFSVQSLS
jgi:hypothetical protein